MTETVRYQCKQCGHRFETQVLTDRERKEIEEQRQPVFPVTCPKCGSQRLART